MQMAFALATIIV